MFRELKVSLALLEQQVPEVKEVCRAVKEKGVKSVQKEIEVTEDSQENAVHKDQKVNPEVLVLMEYQVHLEQMERMLKKERKVIQGNLEHLVLLALQEYH